jgi:hypothetical protein
LTRRCRVCAPQGPGWQQNAGARRGATFTIRLPMPDPTAGVQPLRSRVHAA